MAFKQHKRVRYRDFIRKIIGDPDELLFTNDELKSVFDKWSLVSLSGASPTAQNNRYKIAGCSGLGTPKWQLTVTTGIDGAVYVIDEAASVIFFDPDDPANTAIAPTDGDSITVTYYSMRTAELVSELFFILSSNHTKLTLAHNILGVQMDLKELADSFYNQSIRWKLEECTF